MCLPLFKKRRFRQLPSGWAVSGFFLPLLAQFEFKPFREPVAIVEKCRLRCQDGSEEPFCLGAVMAIAF